MLSAIKPPATEAELLSRCQRIAGLSLGQLAAELGVDVPDNLLKAKGWIGQLLEYTLGTDAGNAPKPDFTALNIELKTLPVNADGIPQESTFVCVAELLNTAGQTWESSLVKHKLSRVLWVPVLTDKSFAVAERRLGQAFLWSPNVEQELTLRTDWQELTDMIALGQLESITARHGEYLQIRPKGANNRSLTWGLDADGRKIKTLPRGFYLRAAFTRELLQPQNSRQNNAIA